MTSGKRPGRTSGKKPPERQAEPRIDIDEWRALAQVMKEFDLGEVELVRRSGERLRLKRKVQGATLIAKMPAIGPLPSTKEAAAPPSSAPEPKTDDTPSVVQTGQVGQAGQASQAGQAARPLLASDVYVVNAPLVGTFYRGSSPDGPAFVSLGQRISKGQVLCIIEAMKLMNELESEADGVVVACLAKDGHPVEYNQPLFHIQRV